MFEEDKPMSQIPIFIQCPQHGDLMEKLGKLIGLHEGSSRERKEILDCICRLETEIRDINEKQTNIKDELKRKIDQEVKTRIDALDKKIEKHSLKNILGSVTFWLLIMGGTILATHFLENSVHKFLKLGPNDGSAKIQVTPINPMTDGESR